jgi:hypothetical protein
MARDGSGTYTRVSNSFSDPVANTTIDPADAIALFDDLETEMTDSLSRTGKGGMSADLDMNNNDIVDIKTAVFQGSSSGNTTVIATAAAGTTTLTLPAATDTLVGKATTDTLTNKTLTSPTLTTPDLGVATATSINKVAITAPASAATLTIPDGVTLTGPASSGTAMTLGNTETVTGIKTFGSAGAVGRLKVAGTTSGTITLDATAVAGTNTLTLPAATDTLVGKATTDTLTNKTFDTAGSGNSFSINGVAATANTGTGSVVRATSPTLVTPALGAATATTINGVTLDNNAWSTYTPTVTAGSGTPTTVTATGRYKQIGKTVIVEMDITITAIGTAAGSLLATLPVNSSASGRYAGSVFEYITSAKSGACYINGPLTADKIQSRPADGTSTWWVNSYALAITVVYEAA